MSDIRVTSISNAHASNAEELTTGGTQVNVISRIMVDGSTAEHGVVLNLGTAERRAVTRDNNQLG